MEKEKLELERGNREKTDLVESQYINCSEDVEKWLNEKQIFENKIVNL